MLKRLPIILRSFLHRTRFEDSMSEELRFHIEEYTDDLVRGGLTREEASRRARIEFGGLEAVKDDCREARGLRILDEIVQDARYAVRVLRKSPGFTATALSTLAICLAANLAVFAVVDAILLRPLPFPSPDRLVRIFNTYPKANVPDDGSSVVNYYERRGAIAAFSSLSLCREGMALAGDTGATDREPVMRVTADFFNTLGAGPALGRAFTEREMDVDAARAAILTDGFWRARLGANPGVVGTTIRVDGIPRIVVGVLPASFRFLSSEARIYLPLVSSAEDREQQNRHSGSSSQMVARLKPGVTFASAQAEIDAHNASMETGSPTAKMMADAGFRSVVNPLHAEHVAAVRPVLVFVQSGAICLLLIGGVNLVNLQLVRATGRAKELAVRQAIGGSRSRVVRQIVVETMVLALTSAALGVALAGFGIRLLSSLGTGTLPLGAQVEFDTTLALVGVGAAALAGLAMAAPVAWYSLRHSAATMAAFEVRGATAAPGVQRLRHAFVVVQVALAFGILSCAALLGLSLRNVTSISPGFRAAEAVVAQISVPAQTYPDTAARRTFVDRLMAGIQRQPGVAAGGIVTNIPFSGRNIKSAITVKGYVRRAGESPRGHYGYGVGGRYFEALGLSLVEGRFLEAAEIQRGDRTVVVDDEFARHYWPAGSALGHQLFAGPEQLSDAEAYTIVGVVGAARQTGLTDAEATGAVFFPYSDRFDSQLFLVARTSLPAEALAPSLREVVRAIDPDLAISDVRSMETRIADSLVTRRSPAVLAGLFSALALLLTAIGTYGVVSYAVATRRREIALRLALGATPSQVRHQFLSLSLRLVVAGSTLGLLCAWIAGGAMRTLLFGVPPLHVPALAITAAAIASLTFAACLVPAVRAARVSPAELLTE